ncbi:aspartate ammonia-lyase [Clostridium saccharobutylicum]|nr:aspartate ammonia-lyase [Clostridium saccharobutylicum]
MGQLELNAFTPLIAECLLESLELLDRSVMIFKDKCIDGLKMNTDRCSENLEKSLVSATALVPYLGYDKASSISQKALATGKTIREILLEEQVLPHETIDKILSPIELIRTHIPGNKSE